ncbi:tetratricopeptide repeat protein [Psychrobacter celer]|uniref:tetratricopeptide repeat protein n=1 Tax=Psychrobacter celer TaxID=306572 RepID=UPI003FD04279
MRVALCISGQMRGYLKAYPSVKKNIIDVFNPDIFVHTWDDIGKSNNLHRRALPHPMIHYLPRKIIDQQSYFSSLFPNFMYELYSRSTINKDELCKIYQPKVCIVEKSPTSEELDSFFGFKPPVEILKKQPKVVWSRNLFYKIHKCNELKKDFEKQNNFKYDLVIRLRPDLSVGEVISPRVDKDTLYYRYRNIDVSYQVGDQYFYADSHTMDKVCDLYKNIEDIWNNYDSAKIHHKYFWAEGLLFTYIQQYHPEIKLFSYRTEPLGTHSKFQLLDATTLNKSYMATKDSLIQDIKSLQDPILKLIFQKALSRALAHYIKKEKDEGLCLLLIVEFENVLEYIPHYAKSILQSKSNIDSAIESAKNALKQENSDEINFHLGKLLYKKKDYAEAQIYLQKAIDLEDEYNRENYLLKWERHKFLGLAEESLGNYCKALSSFMTALSLNERSIESFYRAGKMLYRLSRFSESLYYFNMVLKLKAEHHAAAYLMCLAYCKLGLYANAIEQCSIWIKSEENIQPSEYKFLGPLAIATYYKGQKDKALSYMKLYVNAGKYHEDNILDFIEILAITNERNFAKKLLNSSLKKFPRLQSELNKFKVALK